MNMSSAQIGELIKTTRTELGVTQEMLATAAGTGLRFIVDLEKGKPTCQLEKSLRVLNALGIRIAFTPPTAPRRSPTVKVSR